MNEEDQKIINDTCPYQVFSKNHEPDWYAAVIWCKEYWGIDCLSHGRYIIRDNPRWGWLYTGDDMRPIFYFTSVHDAVEFKLRFG